jgi:hypothetical protein
MAMGFDGGVDACSALAAATAFALGDPGCRRVSLVSFVSQQEGSQEFKEVNPLRQVAEHVRQANTDKNSVGTCS